MGRFRNWLENQQVPRGSDGTLAQPTQTGQQNMKVATNKALESPQNVKKMQDLSKAGLQGSNDKARNIATGMAADFQRDTPDPTTYKGMVASVAQQAPGINAKQLFRDPKMSVSKMRKEGHVIETPKMMWAKDKNTNTPNTILPQKGDTISYMRGVTKKANSPKPPKPANPMGIKLPKTEKHVYKNPFA